MIPIISNLVNSKISYRHASLNLFVSSEYFPPSLFEVLLRVVCTKLDLYNWWKNHQKEVQEKCQALLDSRLISN